MISEKELKGINSPLRNFSLKMKINSYIKQLKKLHINLEHLTILDAGCGRGFSTKILFDKLSPKKTFAFNFLEERVNLAKKLNLDTEFFQGSNTDIQLPAGSSDFVFVFNVLHHVSEWKNGIKDVSRVLKDNGYDIFEEPTGSYTTFTDHLARNKHPEKGKFTKQEFEAELYKNTFVILKDSSAFFGKYIALIC